MARGLTPLATPPSSALSFRLPLITELLPIPDGIGNQDGFLAQLAAARAVGYLLEDPLTLYGIHNHNRFFGKRGRARDRYLANHYVSMATGCSALGADLHALADTFAARALLRSRMGLLLSSEQRRRLAGHLGRLGGERRIRLAKVLAKVLAHRAAYGAKRRLERLMCSARGAGAAGS
jgi:hypothetical protein